MALCTNCGKKLPRLLLVLSAAAVLACVFFLDDSVVGFVKTHGTPASVAFGKTVSKCSEWQWLMLPCALFAIAAHLRKNRAQARVLCAVMISASLAGLAATCIRGVTGRTRPSAPAEIAPGWYGPWHGGRLLVFDSRYNAFPSGHTAVSAGLVAMLLLLRRRAGLLLIPLPVIVAAARICAGAHHLSDVMASLLLGACIAVWLRRRLAGSGFFRTQT
jgi:membrane-associated phospholipid phosphatase